nr:putative carboxylesterase 18 [Quercus suber]
MSPKLPWKIRLLLSTLSIVTDLCRRSNGTINRYLMSLIDFKSPPSENPTNGVQTSDFTVNPSRNLWFRLYTPTTTTTTTNNNSNSLPIIFYFHGGGFGFFAANSKPFDDFCQRLAQEIPSIIISINYRLAPEHNVLSLETVLEAFFGGEERTESETNLAGAPLITVERTDWMWKAFLPQGSDRDHAAANVFGPNSIDISGLKFPATIVFVGGFDPLQDWQKRYYEGLKRAGKEAYLIEYPNAIHTFYGFPEFPESSLMIKEVRDFMQKQSYNDITGNRKAIM